MKNWIKAIAIVWVGMPLLMLGIYIYPRQVLGTLAMFMILGLMVGMTYIVRTDLDD